MPELPEVETIIRALRPKVVGRQIKQVEILTPKSFQGASLKLIGRRVVNLRRRAKLIIFELDKKLFLVVHLKMTGQLIYLAPGKRGRAIVGGHPDRAYRQQTGLPHKYTRVRFEFSDGGQLFFNDLRRFGWVKVMGESEVAEIDRERGIEPLSNQFTLRRLDDLMRRYPRRRAKDFLHDQRLIAGIGNIYASEILFCARVLPWRRLASLTQEERKNIFQCVKKVLRLALKYKGTSLSDYLRPDGRRGGFMDQAMVYYRAGQPCRICGHKIRRKKIGQRSAYYCLVCQH